MKTFSEGLKVLITDPSDQILIDKLKRAGFAVDYDPEISASKVKSIIGDYSAMVVRSRTKVTAEIISSAHKLRVIARAGVGLDGIDTKAAQERSIAVINSPEASTQSVAELNIGLLLSAIRRIPGMVAGTRSGVFKKEMGTELKDKTLGIIGFGRIGHRTALIAHAIGMKIMAADPVRSEERISSVDGEYTSVDEIVARSDYVGLFLNPDKPEKPVLDGERLHAMKQNAGLLNTSRAANVDGPALLEQLSRRRILFYATDVMWNEPPKEEWEYRLISLDSFLLTPHIGSQTVEAQHRIAEQTADKISALLLERSQ